MSIQLRTPPGGMGRRPKEMASCTWCVHITITADTAAAQSANLWLRRSGSVWEEAAISSSRGISVTDALTKQTLPYVGRRAKVALVFPDAYMLLPLRAPVDLTLDLSEAFQFQQGRTYNFRVEPSAFELTFRGANYEQGQAVVPQFQRSPTEASTGEQDTLPVPSCTCLHDMDAVCSGVHVHCSRGFRSPCGATRTINGHAARLGTHSPHCRARFATCGRGSWRSLYTSVVVQHRRVAHLCSTLRC